MSRQLAKHWITADEYERMGEAGISGDDARLELIEGAIYQMSPTGSPHAAYVTMLHQLLTLKGVSQASRTVKRGEEARAHSIENLSVGLSDIPG